MIDRFLTVTANAFDRAMVASVAARNRRREGRGQAQLKRQTLQDRLELISQISDFYRTHTDAMFDTDALLPAVIKTPIGEWIKHIERTDLRFSSPARVLLDRLRESYESDTHNAQMHARWFGRIGSGRPVAILVHGYLGGDFAWEQRFWPIELLYSWGLDVVLVALPFHGRRKDPKRSAPPKFPAVDPAWNIESFRQAMIDLRTLLALARQWGHAQVGVFGMSLGGYSSSLLATVEPSLAFCVPMIPLASIPDFVRDHGRFPGEPQDIPVMYDALERCMQVVAPTARPLAIDPQRVTIVAASGDGITRIEHAQRLATHFDSEIVRFAGGHLLQFGRDRALGRVREKLIEQGVLPPRA
jgi:hypothetical protein